MPRTSSLKAQQRKKKLIRRLETRARLREIKQGGAAPADAAKPAQG